METLLRDLGKRGGLIVLAAAVSPAAALAAPGAQEAGIFDARYLLQVAGSLLLVLGCLMGLLFVLKRMNGIPDTDRKALRILGSLKVGTREKVVLLEAGSSQLLLGVAAGSVRTLHVIDDAQSSASAAAGVPAAGVPAAGVPAAGVPDSEFAEALKQAAPTRHA